MSIQYKFFRRKFNGSNRTCAWCDKDFVKGDDIVCAVTTDDLNEEVVHRSCFEHSELWLMRRCFCHVEYYLEDEVDGAVTKEEFDRNLFQMAIELRRRVDDILSQVVALSIETKSIRNFLKQLSEAKPLNCLEAHPNNDTTDSSTSKRRPSSELPGGS